MILFSHSLRIFRSVVLLEKRLTGVLRPDHLQSLRMTQAAVITVSDSCSRGEQEDLSGPAVTRELETHGFDVQERVLVPDDREAIEDALRVAARRARLVVTTGGTGIARRDVTPDATRAAGREETPFTALGRWLCGAIDTARVLNLPGNPAGAVTSLRAVAPLLEHAFDLLAGKTEHGGKQD
jgi:molybdopterin adenylyltransferase